MLFNITFMMYALNQALDKDLPDNTSRTNHVEKIGLLSCFVACSLSYLAKVLISDEGCCV